MGLSVCPLIPRFLSIHTLYQLKALSVIYRERLQSISWFMRLLNEYIARRANKEDECKGYFWERRFRSQAILDEKALASVMAYVDLNPIRAKISRTLKGSHFTSIQYRLNAQRVNKTPKFLMPFSDRRVKDKVSLPFAFVDYNQLINDTLTAEKNDSVQKLPLLPSRLLTKLGMTKENWHLVTNNFETLFTGPVGCPEMMDNFAKCCQRACRPNLANAQKYLS